MSKRSTRDFLTFLFEESQTDIIAGETPKGGDAPNAMDKAKIKDGKLAEPAKREEAEEKLKTLASELKKLGIEKAEERLSWESGEFKLIGDKDTHASDSEILQDLTKIGPLVDAGFAVIDGESSEHGYSFIFICTDSFYEEENEGGVSDVEGMTAAEVDDKKKDENVTKAAEDLVKKVLENAKKS